MTSEQHEPDSGWSNDDPGHHGGDPGSDAAAGDHPINPPDGDEGDPVTEGDDQGPEQADDQEPASGDYKAGFDTVEFYRRDSDGKWAWRYMSANGVDKMATDGGQGYDNLEDARSGAGRVTGHATEVKTARRGLTFTVLG